MSGTEFLAYCSGVGIILLCLSVLIDALLGLH